MDKYINAAPTFEETYRQHEFSELVRITLLLADGLSGYFESGA